MKNALILHGTDNTSKDNWFPWLKTKLEKAGYKVWVPDLPEADKPSIKRYNRFIFNSNWQFNKDSVIVGHSSGAVAILGLLQALPADVQVKAVYLVGSFKDDLGWKALKGLFTEPFDFDLIKKKSKKFVFIHSDNDPYCPLDHARYLHKKLGGDLIVLKGQKHFSTSTYGEKYRQFPFLAHLILEDTVNAEFVAEFYKKLKAHNINIWLDGGWAVDALVGKQTRNHEDLDIILRKEDLKKFSRLVKEWGYFLVDRDDTKDHNFLLVDDQTHLVDVHVVELDASGNGIYGPKKNNQVYPAWALEGKGVVNSTSVKCVTAKYAKESRRGYELREKDKHDLKVLAQL